MVTPNHTLAGSTCSFFSNASSLSLVEAIDALVYLGGGRRGRRREICLTRNYQLWIHYTLYM